MAVSSLETRVVGTKDQCYFILIEEYSQAVLK